MNVLLFAIACLIPYLIGSINTSIVLSRSIGGEDIRSSGSGNAGATNMLRTYGKGLAIITLICDILKGVISVLLGVLLTYLAGRFIIPAGSGEVGISVTEKSFSAICAAMPYYKYLGAFFAVVGHNFPVYFRFKGGKGVAASLGAIVTLNWQVGLIVLAFALLIMIVTRYVSLGSVLAAVIYIAVDFSQMIFTGGFDTFRFVFDVLLAGLIIIRHRENIKRLLAGTENKLGAKKKGND